MIPSIHDYAKFIGKEKIEELKEKAEKLSRLHITHINSTSAGGGVAEILHSIVALMNKMGVWSGWRLFKGTNSFFSVTKKFHNALQGKEMKLTPYQKDLYLEETERNSLMNHFKDHDLVIVHDPQPLAMIRHYRKRQPWIWRCHIDITNPDKNVWKFLNPYMNMYDGTILSLKNYKKRSIKCPQHIIEPSIDPLSLKNMHLTNKYCEKRLSRNHVDPDRPFICQISRFDKWKDPLGVLRIYKKVKQKIPKLQLVLMGDMASDDPEGPKIYTKIFNKAREMNDEDVILITNRDDKLVNVLQRKAKVIFQNSKREGFGLTVSEALWKGTPVITKAAGGLPLQVKNGKNGYVVDSYAEAAKRCIKLIQDRHLAKELGEHGKEHVKKHFLITRHLENYLDLIWDYCKPPKI